MNTVFFARVNLNNNQALFVWINNGLTNFMQNLIEFHNFIKKVSTINSTKSRKKWNMNLKIIISNIKWMSLSIIFLLQINIFLKMTFLSNLIMNLKLFKKN